MVIAVPCSHHRRAAGRLIYGSAVHPIGGVGSMNVMQWIRPSRTVEAHCDLPCGIYDPEQARIEAESVYNIIKKYNDSKDEVYRQRAIAIKEERAEREMKKSTLMAADHMQEPVRRERIRGYA